MFKLKKFIWIFIIDEFFFLSQYQKKDLTKCHKLNIKKYLNYNKYKNIENWSREFYFLYSSFNFFEDSQLNTNVTWHDAYCQVEKKNPKLDPNSIIKCNTYI